MENFIPVLVILGVLGFILWKNKDKIVQLADKFTDRGQKPEAIKPESGAPYKVPDPPISISPIEVKPAEEKPVLQPNVGLAGFRITPENAAILDARVREDHAAGVNAGTYRNIFSCQFPLTSQSAGGGENFLIDLSTLAATFNVVGPIRIDMIATADSPARGGAMFGLHAQPDSGVGITGQNTANSASIVVPAGNHRISAWADQPAKAWIVFR